MAFYTEFSLQDLKKKFQLTEETQSLFATVEKVVPSPWLQQTLAIGLSEHLLTEKERSERILSPILFEIRERNHRQFSIYSGFYLNVNHLDEPKHELKGDCDFILAAQPMKKYTLEVPIFCLLEAEDDAIRYGLSDCVAQMLGAKILNQQQGNSVETIYGCVTTGEVWQFLKLEKDTIVVDDKCYYINQVEDILGVLQQIVNFHIGTRP